MTSGDIRKQMKDMVAETFSPEVAKKLRATLILDVEEVSYIGLWPEAEKITAESNIDSCLKWNIVQV